jgi:hypothetical protein
MLPALATRETRLTPPTGSALQLLLGSLLGDGGFDLRPTHPRYRVNHGAPQHEYVKHKAAILRDYVQSPPRLVKSGGYGALTSRLQTVTTPAFEPLASLCYQAGRKTVTREWLDQLTWEGFAFWFMDDGHVTRSAAGISTHGFSEAEVRLIASWLAGRGLPAQVDTVTTASGKVCWAIRFRLREAIALVELIRPFVPECMSYKVVLTPRPERPCSVCGAVFTPRHAIRGIALCGKNECRLANNNRSWAARRAAKALPLPSCRDCPTQISRKAKRCSPCRQRLHAAKQRARCAAARASAPA